MLGWLKGLGARTFLRKELAEEMDEEQRAHIALRADDLERAGLSRAQAERRARVEFGARERIREESVAAMGGNFAGTVMNDVLYAARVLRKSPEFAMAAIGTLALAIGANAVVFSVLNALILRPLNVPQAASLYALQRGSTASGSESYPNYADLRDRNRSFEGLAAYSWIQAGLDAGGDPSSVWAIEASGNYFDAMGLKPYLGRLFQASDEHGTGSAPYIVLTYDYWHTHFNDDRGVVGRVVRLDKIPFTIIGVAPRDYSGTLMFFHPDMFVPMMNPLVPAEDLTTRGNRWMFEMLGHVKAGVTPAQAAADLDAIGSQLEKTYPKDEARMTFVLARPNLYGDYLGRPIKAFMAGLMLLAGLILLAACANLGSLFAARAADRSKEVALRLALGSSRRRILRGLFTEAVLISVAGGGAGLLASVVLLRELSAWRPFVTWPAQVAVNPDAKVYAVAVLLALLSGLLFGAVPVKQVLAASPYEVVKGVTGSRAGKRMSARDVLLVVQIAICAVLVTSSLVAVRGLVRSLHASLGVRIEHNILAETDLGMAGYTGDRVPEMQRKMVDAMAAIPGVQAAALADSLPMGIPGDDSIVFRDNTSDLRPINAAATANVYKVSPKYFRADGTELVSGRDFTWQDDGKAPRVAVVNEQFARQIFGSSGGAMGRVFKLRDGTRVQVVGIAEDGKYGSLTEDPLPVMFLPILQSPSTTSIVVVESERDPNQLAGAMRLALRQLDAGLPVRIETRDKPLQTYLFGPRMATMTLGVLGLLGAMLSITGIFGLAAYSVSKRMKELGIRVALGAKRAEVVKTVLGRAVRLLAIGSAAGLALGMLATRVLAYIVYEATPRDPLVLAGVVAAMALLGLVATWIPAQRALRVDPMQLLREE